MRSSRLATQVYPGKWFNLLRGLGWSRDGTSGLKEYPRQGERLQNSPLSRLGGSSELSHPLDHTMRRGRALPLHNLEGGLKGGPEGGGLEGDLKGGPEGGQGGRSGREGGREREFRRSGGRAGGREGGGDEGGSGREGRGRARLSCSSVAHSAGVRLSLAAHWRIVTYSQNTFANTNTKHKTQNANHGRASVSSLLKVAHTNKAFKRGQTRGVLSCTMYPQHGVLLRVFVLIAARSASVKIAGGPQPDQMGICLLRAKRFQFPILQTAFLR